MKKLSTGLYGMMRLPSNHQNESAYGIIPFALLRL